MLRFTGNDDSIRAARLDELRHNYRRKLMSLLHVLRVVVILGQPAALGLNALALGYPQMATQATSLFAAKCLLLRLKTLK